MYRKTGVWLCVLVLALMTAPELVAQKRIVFRRGTTSTTVSGSLAAVRERDFVLGARAGQYLSATVSSRGGCVEFAGGGTSLSYTTRRGSNYITVVNNCNRTVGFTLTVSIE